MSSWNPIRNPIDFFILQHAITPGIGRIEKPNSPRKWDERGGYGASGSVLVFMGRRLSTFDGIIELYTEDDWVAWEEWKVLVDREPYGKRPKALDIWHPWTQGRGIKSCVVEDVLGPEELEKGGHRFVIQFKEWRPMKLSLAKPEASKNTPSDDPYDKAIENLTAQFQELAKK